MTTIHYTVAILQPHTHLIDVTISVVPAADTREIQLHMPVWTPGSYLVREYARHVRDFSAQQGAAPCTWHKQDKATWLVQGIDGVRPLTVQYRVYAYDLSVRTNHVDETHAFFNPAALIMAVAGVTGPLPLTVHTKADWRVATQLEVLSQHQVGADERVWQFVAPQYDALYDAPFEIGTHRHQQFWVNGALHEVVLWGAGNEDLTVLVHDIERAVRGVMSHFQTVPYTRYVFILHLADGMYGGLEHCASTVCLVDRWGFVRPSDYERILGLITHEYFHTWNVKQIRPAPLGPFDYQRENYTRQLWLVEGVTSYYDNLIMCRSGMITQARYLDLLASDIASVQRTPGRQLQSLAEASFDAWIRYYRPDENSVNVSVSYYVKGAVVAFALDMLIRRHSQGRASFDDVLRALESRYPLHLPGIPEDDTMERLIAEVCDIEYALVAQFFAAYIYGRDELPYAELLATVGLHAQWHHVDDITAGMGLTLRQDGQRLLVSAVFLDSSAMHAGIAPHDEIIALNGNRVDLARWRARMRDQVVGDVVTVSYFRRDELRTVSVVLEAEPATALRLQRQGDGVEFERWLAAPIVMGQDGE
jgi:predicted metalloprotease with PDZ domain